MTSLDIRLGEDVWVKDYLFTVDGFRREGGLLVLELSIPDNEEDGE